MKPIVRIENSRRLVWERTTYGNFNWRDRGTATLEDLALEAGWEKVSAPDDVAEEVPVPARTTTPARPDERGGPERVGRAFVG